MVPSYAEDHGGLSQKRNATIDFATISERLMRLNQYSIFL
jgi:hypothetical protein